MDISTLQGGKVDISNRPEDFLTLSCEYFGEKNEETERRKKKRMRKRWEAARKRRKTLRKTGKK